MGAGPVACSTGHHHLLLCRAGLGHHRPLWLAVHTVPGDEELIGAAHVSLAQQHPGLCTVLLPADASRCPSVAHMLHTRFQLHVAGVGMEGLRSGGETAPPDVLLVAKSALLPLLYRWVCHCELAAGVCRTSGSVPTLLGARQDVLMLAACHTCAPSICSVPWVHGACAPFQMRMLAWG